MKLLSIIIPSFNMEAYLARCLSSLIVGDVHLLAAIDVIVVNDGSTDGTSQLAHEWMEKFPEVIRVVDKSNGHYGSCINAALSIAKGTYVRILDADDRFETKAFEHYLRRLEETRIKPVDMVFSDCVTSNSKLNANIIYRQSLSKNSKLYFDGDISKLPMAQMHCIAYRTQMLRDNDYRQTEGVPYTDTEWTTYPLLFVHEVLYLDDIVYHYYIGREGQSMDAKIIKKSLFSSLKILQTAICVEEKHVLGMGRKCIIENFIKACITGLYLKPLRFLGISEAKDALRVIDGELLAMSRHWYDYAYGLKCPRKGKIGFEFVKRYRSGTIGIIYILSLRLYLKTLWASIESIWRFKMLFTKGKIGCFSAYSE